MANANWTMTFLIYLEWPSTAIALLTMAIATFAQISVGYVQGYCNHGTYWCRFAQATWCQPPPPQGLLTYVNLGRARLGSQID